MYASAPLLHLLYHDSFVRGTHHEYITTKSRKCGTGHEAQVMLSALFSEWGNYSAGYVVFARPHFPVKAASGGGVFFPLENCSGTPGCPRAMAWGRGNLLY